MSRNPDLSVRLTTIKQHVWRFVRQNLPLVILLVLITLSFIYGWFFDSSIPFAGRGWADQETYWHTARRIAYLQGLTPGDLHFTIGYPLLGAFGYFFSTTYPFFIISYGLYIGSAIFCFLAAREIFKNQWWAFIFCSLLFVWDGAARTLRFASEIFMMPWNNQVTFFVFSFLLWLLTVKVKTKPSYRLVAIAGLVCGVGFLVREETVVFILPLLVTFLVLSRAGVKKSVLAVLLMLLCFLPQLIVKNNTLGSVTGTARDKGYSQLAGRYLDSARLLANIDDTIVRNDDNLAVYPGQPALLQSAPWLVLAPLGIVPLLKRWRSDVGLIIFIVVSAGLALFYLSGPNINPLRLQFHGVRYISPSFIAINLMLVLGLRWVFTGKELTKQTLSAEHNL